MQDVQIFRVQGVSVGKTIVQRRDRPFFREVFIFRAVKPKDIDEQFQGGIKLMGFIAFVMISSEPWYIVIRFSMIFPPPFLLIISPQW